MPSTFSKCWHAISEEDELSDEEALAEAEEVAAFVAAMQLMLSTERNFKWPNERLTWNEHVAKLTHTKEFDQTYHMSLKTFQKLLAIIHCDITVDVIKAKNSMPDSEPIYPELVMHIGIRWLAGGSYHDIHDLSSVSTSSVYHCRDLFINAVLRATALDICFPEMEQEISEAAQCFKAKSSHGVMSGCVGCVDGILIQITQPKDVPNLWAYFSGHYNVMGLNVQAVCDAQLHFIYVAVSGPGKQPFAVTISNDFVSHNVLHIHMELSLGKTPDITAYRNITLPQLVEKLPAGFYITGDPAYIPTEHMLTPYSGSQRNDEANDIFNFYLSQLRIRIEMAFGLLTTKWRIFRRPLEGTLENQAKIIETCARLHNLLVCRVAPDKMQTEVEYQEGGECLLCKSMNC